MKQARAFPVTSAVAAPSTRTWPNLWTLPRGVHLDWAYASTGKRDMRLDLLRGFAVFVMVVDHLGGPSWLYLLTGGNGFAVSAAEAFIFISGLVVGLVYGGIALEQGLRAAQGKALQRALTLYKLTVALTLIFASLSFLFDLPWAKELHADGALAFVFDVVTLRRTMYLTDIPLMYTFLMFLAPIGLWLLAKGRTVLLLAGSAALWLAFQLFPTQAQFPWPIIGNTTFNLAAWQILFFVGMGIGFHHDALTKTLRQMPRWPYFLFSGLLLVWMAAAYGNAGALLEGFIPGLDPQALMSALFLKGAVAPGRLLASVIVFQFAFLAATLDRKSVV